MTSKEQIELRSELIKTLVADFKLMFPESNRETVSQLHAQLSGLDTDDIKLLVSQTEKRES